MKALKFIEEELEIIAVQNQERTLKLHNNENIKGDFSSKDYLALAGSELLIEVAIEAMKKYGVGARASRLLSGNLPIHMELEEEIALWKRKESALLFGSGFLANIGVIPALVGEKDIIIADRLIHASLVDAALLSRAKFFRFNHNDPSHLEFFLKRRGDYKNCIIITESVFSMDGDIAPLKEIKQLADQHDALLYIDEAHSTGIFGPEGAGIALQENIVGENVILMGTLSKAIGAYGAFVATSERVKKFLVNKARSLIYSTAIPPAIAAAALAGIRWIRNNSEAGKKLLVNAKLFREKLHNYKIDTLQSASQIVPVMIGQNGLALAISRFLLERQILALAIRPPTVPQNKARIRFSITLKHTQELLIEVALLLAEAFQNVKR